MLKDNSSGYRKNVGLIILNKKCKVLLCKRSKTDNWQFPQGGIDTVSYTHLRAHET